MTRMVHCVLLGREAEGLDYKPHPGELGERVYQNVSKEGWQRWVQHQTMLINEYRLTPFEPKARQFLEGEMEKFFFGEGSDRPEEYHRLLTGPAYDEAWDRFDVTLDGVLKEHAVGEGLTEAAAITIRSRATGIARPETIRINRPLAWGDLEFHFGARIGYSPELIVLDADGEPVFRGFVRLAAPRGSGDLVHEDFVLLPDDDLRVRLAVHPGPDAGTAPERHVAVERGHEELWSGVLAPGDTAAVAGLRLTVPRLRRWCYVDVVENPFLEPVFAGFWIGLAGLTISALARTQRKDRSKP